MMLENDFAPFDIFWLFIVPTLSNWFILGWLCKEI